MNSPNITREGYLTKLGYYLPTWRQRWFVLAHGKLLYYTDHTRKSLKGVIHLKSSTATSVVQTGNRSYLCITSGKRQFILYAKTDQDTIDWEVSIKKHMRPWTADQQRGNLDIGDFEILGRTLREETIVEDPEPRPNLDEVMEKLKEAERIQNQHIEEAERVIDELHLGPGQPIQDPGPIPSLVPVPHPPLPSNLGVAVPVEPRPIEVAPVQRKELQNPSSSSQPIRQGNANSMPATRSQNLLSTSPGRLFVPPSVSSSPPHGHGVLTVPTVYSGLALNSPLPAHYLQPPPIKSVHPPKPIKKRVKKEGPQVLCPYVGCKKSMEIPRLIRHVNVRHSHSVDQYPCPICPTKPQVHLVDHVNQEHLDLVPEDASDSDEEEMLQDSDPTAFIEAVVTEANDDFECTICFEPFEVGQVTARVLCFCLFHKKCLLQWYVKRKCCPLHQT